MLAIRFSSNLSTHMPAFQNAVYQVWAGEGAKCGFSWNSKSYLRNKLDDSCMNLNLVFRSVDFTGGTPDSNDVSDFSLMLRLSMKEKLSVNGERAGVSGVF